MVSMHLRFQPVCTQGYDNSDLELMHHYTTCTVHTLLDVYGIRSPDVLMMYQRRTPRLAFGHPFLMHAILSFASLHLLWLNKSSAPSTSRQYYVLSCYHRSQAVLSYNAKDFTNHLCSSSSQFLTNLLLSLHVVCDSNLAMPDEVHPELRMLHWFRTGKSSMDRLYCTKRGGMLIGPFSPASSQGQGPSVYFPSPPPTLSKPTHVGISSISACSQVTLGKSGGILLYYSLVLYLLSRYNIMEDSRGISKLPEVSFVLVNAEALTQRLF
ncbi:hypothetical protein DL96DRAFT_1586287 [Flagelloscypha sp. PMI_526]|nr:hypothetical protein DL96DRAFT_1586287 [Flagelloscypha sp. PMI_526]